VRGLCPERPLPVQPGLNISNFARHTHWVASYGRAMRSVDLALFADELAARAATLAAQLGRARGRLRHAAIEREARRALDETSVARLESLGILRIDDPGEIRSEIQELARSLEAVEELQAWVERRLFEAAEDAA
jgi:hypothetical protein